MNETLQSFLRGQIETLKAEHLYKPLVTIEGPPGARVTVDGRSMINLSSNNYLGLAGDTRLRKAAADAALEIGAGSGAVRPIIGNLALHDRLEKTLAEFKGVERVMVFQSGFTANAGTIPTVLTKDDAILTDALNHASIIDGCRLASVPREKSQNLRPLRHGISGERSQRDAKCEKAAHHHRRRLLDGRRYRAAG